MQKRWWCQVRLGFVSLRVMDSMGCVFITTTVLSSAKRKASPVEDAAASVAAAFALGIVERPIDPWTLQFACACS